MKSTLKKWRDLAINPLEAKRGRVRRNPNAPLDEKIAYDVHARPHFAYGIHRAAKQAKALGLPGISALEFGCAGGNGLVAMEEIAAEIGAHFNMQIDVYGFDIGEGLPKPLDYRDLPYAWKSEQFKMDIPKLEARLTTAQLVIGDVNDTVDPFLARDGLMPVGFISFDLDYYTSTINAFRIFSGASDACLPRVYCYFDDIIGPDNELHCKYVGELLAIEEFNAAEPMKKLAPIHGLSHKRYLPHLWNDAMYIMHGFEHPLYDQYIETGVDMALALKD